MSAWRQCRGDHARSSRSQQLQETVPGNGPRLTPQFTDAGFRICCGRASELPEFSCVDLTKENGEFGIFGRCLGDGEPFDAKFAGAICCAGLTRTDSSVEADGGVAGDPAGCLSAAAPSIKACRPWGNGRCDPGEDRCNCPADCS